MRILKFLLSTLLILLGIFLIGGFFIPDEWTVSRSITIHASPDEIYPYVSNFAEWQKWSPWSTSKNANLKYTYEGPDAGVGAKQRWISEKMGTGWMKITSADPHTGIAYDLFIDMGSSHSMLHGDIAFSQDKQETKVTWTDSGKSEKGYIKRWMSLIIKPMLGKDLDQGLAELKSIVEKKKA